jgi:hypothetical protein
MAKANQTYHKRDLYSDAAQVMTLARYYAKQAVKAQWLGQGIKLSHVEPSELNRVANAYLSQHREELIERAVQQLRHSHSNGSADLQGLSLCKCHGRNGGSNNYRICTREHRRPDVRCSTHNVESCLC